MAKKLNVMTDPEGRPKTTKLVVTYPKSPLPPKKTVAPSTRGKPLSSQYAKDKAKGK